MISLKPLWALFFLLVCSASLAADTVNIAIFQKTPVSGENPRIGEAARIIENSIMDYYFEMGYIISNERASVIWEDYEEGKAGLQQASAGYAEYFVAILIPLKTTVQPVNIRYIDTVSWRVVRTQDGQVIARGETVPGKSEQNEKDPVRGIRNFAAAIARDTINVIQKSRYMQE